MDAGPPFGRFELSQAITFLRTSDPDATRRTVRLWLLVLALVAAVEARRAQESPFTGSWTFISSDFATIGYVFASIIIWVIASIAVYRNEPQKPTTKWELLHKLTGPLGYPWVTLVAFLVMLGAALVWSNTPSAIAFRHRIDRPDMSGFICDTRLQHFDTGTGTLGEIIAQAGRQRRAADECGAFINAASFEELSVFQGHAGQRLRVVLEIGDANCDASPPTGSGAQVYFSDAAIQGSHWNLATRDFVQKDCIVLDGMVSVPAHTLVRFAVAYDCASYSAEATPSVLVKARITTGDGSQRVTLKTDSKTLTPVDFEEHKRQHAEACASSSGTH